jgi:hypothetical protein
MFDVFIALFKKTLPTYFRVFDLITRTIPQSFAATINM